MVLSNTAGRRLFAGKLWQRNYYEHVVRDEDDLSLIRDYVAGNPGRWAEDGENPARMEADR